MAATRLLLICKCQESNPMRADIFYTSVNWLVLNMKQAGIYIKILMN